MATFAKQIAIVLESAGCNRAFGISGGFIFDLWCALDESSICVNHFRHESGAAFAAMEYSLHTEKIAVVFATSGPGISNATTALLTARADGARLLFLSALTAEDNRDQRGMQETTINEVKLLASSDNINAPLNDYIIIRDLSDLAVLQSRLYKLSSEPTGGVVGVFIEPRVQKKVFPPSQLSVWLDIDLFREPKSVDNGNARASQYADHLTSRLRTGKYMLWVGYGARRTSKLVRQVAELFSTPVICTPRAKGIFPETHPLYLGMTGLGSTIDIKTTSWTASGVIILGTRLAELSSSHIQRQWHDKDIICVNLEDLEVSRNVPGIAVILRVNINHLLLYMLKGSNYDRPVAQCLADPRPIPWQQSAKSGMVHPVTVMSVVQSIAIDQYNCSIITDAGNSLCWTAHYLQFNQPGKYRTSLHVAAMGYGSCGAVGIGLAGLRVVAVVGDGAMLMQSEVSTAVQYGVNVTWLVMNDGRYNMCYQVPRQFGREAPCCEIPEVDFAQYGRALGSRGVTVRSGEELQQVLRDAIVADGPTVVDVKIDPDAIAPSGERAASLNSVVVSS